MRALPVHIVEAVLSANVAAAAILATLFLGEPFTRSKWLAVAILVVALIVVADSAGTPGVRSLGGIARWPLPRAWSCSLWPRSDGHSFSPGCRSWRSAR